MELENELINIEFSDIKLENIKDISRRDVLYTSIDYSMHTNNVEYVRFIMDIYNDKKINSFEIHYKHESLLNDKFEIRHDDNIYEMYNQNNILIAEAKIE